MQDLASEFSKIFLEWYPWTLTSGGGARTWQHPGGPLAGRGAPGVAGPKPWAPLNFAVVAPLQSEVVPNRDYQFW